MTLTGKPLYFKEKRTHEDAVTINIFIGGLFAH